MTGSAVVGHPPASQDDIFIVKGLLRVLHVPEALIHPERGFPPSVPRPPEVHYRSRGVDIAAGAAVTIGLVALITGTRLALRWRRQSLQWGLDDWFIIPAAVSSLPFLESKSGD